MTQQPGMFAGMGNAKRSFGSNYINPGKYLMRVDACSAFVTRRKANSFKAEMTVLYHIDDNGGAANNLGEVVTWLAQDDPYPESFLPKCKQFVGVCTGATDEEINEECMNMVTGTEQALAGYVIEVHVLSVPKKTQPQGHPAGAPPVMTTKTLFRRAVSNAEVEKLMDPTWKAKLYPNGIPKDS